MLTRQPSQAATPDHARYSEAAVEQAISAYEFDHAATLLCGRASLGLDVTDAWLADVMPRLADPHVVLHLAFMSKDLPALAVRVVEGEAFPQDPVGQLLAALLVLVSVPVASAAVKARLLAAARVIALGAAANVAAVAAVLHAVTDHATDGALRAVLPERERDTPADLRVVTALAQRTRGLPRLMLGAELLKYLAVRDAGAEPTAPVGEIGRNALCPCGSGKKFKRCHAELARHAAPPPAARGLTQYVVETLPLAQLGRQALTRAAPEALAAVVDRSIKYGLWPLAERALAALERSAEVSADFRDIGRLRVVSAAVRRREFAVATPLVGRFTTASGRAFGHAAAVAIAVGTHAATALDELSGLVADAARAPGDQLLEHAATLLCAVEPGLGLLLLRGAVGSTPPGGEPPPFTCADEARVRLGLPPGDESEQLARAVADVRATAAEHGRMVAGLRSERAAAELLLADALQRAKASEQRAGQLEHELAAERAAPPPQPAVAAIEPSEVRALRQRIADLEQLVRERNETLVELRRTRSNADAGGARGTPALRAVDAPAERAREGGWEDAAATERPLLVPTWTTPARDALGDYPHHIAREALRTATDLAAGEAAAWRGVKRAKRLTTTLLMARVGLYHRMLFVVGDGLTVLDVVKREALELALKRHAAK